MSIKGHEYIVQNGVNRSKVGKILYSLAALLTGLFVWLLTRYVKWFEVVPTFLSTIILTALIFYGLYYVFNIWLWRINPIAIFLRTPNIAGEWSCSGTSDHENLKWLGNIRINQSWDKIRIILTTEQSSSQSISAVIVYDDMLGYKIIFNYENKPHNLDDTNLKTHIGFVDLNLNKDNNEATGFYYNVTGRRTSGIITWSKM